MFNVEGKKKDEAIYSLLYSKSIMPWMLAHDFFDPLDLMPRIRCLILMILGTYTMLFDN